MLIVSPANLEETEGEYSIETRTDTYRVQWLYLASDFDSIPEGGAFIAGHAFRADGSQTTEVTNSFGHSVFTLSTTTLSSLSSDFADNLGDDAAIVYEGSLASTYPVSGPPEGPNPFGTGVEYQNWFFYDPSLGNLVLEEVTTVGNDLADTYKDWGQSGNSTLAASNPEAVSGEDNRAVIVSQFTIVPEPSSSFLVVLGLLGLAMLRRRGRM